MRPKSSPQAALALAALLVAGVSTALAESHAEHHMTPEEQAMMAAMERAAKVGAEHQWLASSAGSWTFVGTFWHGPGGDSSSSPGTAERSMIHGGRVMVEKVASTMEGQPFEGTGMMGYDNISKRWWGTWTDSMSTGVMSSDGTCTDGKCAFESKWWDPITGQLTTGRMTSEHSADREVHAMYGPGPDGKEWKMMELIYTRKK